MIRIAALSLCLAAALSISCGTTPPAGQPALDCSNSLNGADFGFALTVPAEFTCTDVFPNPISIALVGYRNAANVLVSVQVNRPQQGQDGVIADGVTLTVQDPYTNPAGIAFSQFRSELLGRVVVGAAVPMPSGNVLVITVTGPDAPELASTRQAIIDTVTLTP